MPYVLQDLLKIRMMREQWAKDELIKAQNVLEAAIKKVEKKKKELADFRIWRKKEEERLYAEVMLKHVKRTDIDGLKINIANLEKRELEHVQAVDDAEKEREQAKEALAQARSLYNLALVNVQKLEEHKETWMAQWSKEQELLVEKEMEDFKALKIKY